MSDLVVRRRAALELRKVKAGARLHSWIQMAMKTYDQEMWKISQEETALAEMEGQPEVYARRSGGGGPPITTYHLRSCGKCPVVPEALLLGEAYRRGLQPCFFCAPPRAVAAEAS